MAKKYGEWNIARKFEGKKNTTRVVRCIRNENTKLNVLAPKLSVNTIMVNFIFAKLFLLF